MAGGRLERAGSPTGLKRLLLRAPIWLYRSRLGFLLGSRFLMLEHTGRRSGLTRRTVLEVVTTHRTAVYVAAGWGDEADWLRNIRADPHVTVHAGRHVFSTRAAEIDEEQARSVLGEYANAHARAFDRLAHFMLDEPGRDRAEQVQSLAASVPVVELPIPAR